MLDFTVIAFCAVIIVILLLPGLSTVARNIYTLLAHFCTRFNVFNGKDDEEPDMRPARPPGWATEGRPYAPHIRAFLKNNGKLGLRMLAKDIPEDQKCHYGCPFGVCLYE